jgi:hypothetical protein
MPPLTGAEDDEQLERREIESAFRRALCRRVWCKLTPDQRRAMRSAVFTRDPTYASSCGTALDWECLREIERAVEADEEETAVTHA